MTTKTNLNELFADVAGVMENAVLVSYDGCHKIYVAMDELEANWFRENYEYIFEGTPEEMLATVIGWYENSCFLRFVNAVSYNDDTAQTDFTTLVPQFADDDDEDEQENDEDDEDF